MHVLKGKKVEFSLFLISFLILFFELVCIRWVSSTVSYIGLFSNVILLAAFLGIGVGCILHDRKITLLTYFPVLVFFFVHLMSSGVFNSTIYSRALMSETGSIFEKTPLGRIVVDSPILIGVIFAFVSVLFVCLSQELGRLLPVFKPLKSYAINISGSILGIVSFSLMSYLSLGPMQWFTVFYALLLIYSLVNRQRGSFFINFFIFIPVSLASIYFISYGFGESGYEVQWSPYYRIEKIGNVILVNKIGHQTIREPPDMESVQYPPRYLFDEPFEDVLIVGSGTGTDTAVALYYGNKNVDAVEIDPNIIELGRRYSPTKPYSDPRVTVVNDDARSYLMNTEKKYDLIIYGLTDSLTALSTYGSLRLESYLYTREAFEEVRDHLKEDGLFVTGNYYPKRWFADKLVVMLEDVFGYKPYVKTFLSPGEKPAFLGETEAVMTYIGPRIENSQLDSDYEVRQEVTAATDDWPFFYIKNPGVPELYLKGLGVVAAFTLILFIALKSAGYVSKVNPHFFFLGAAFMLLETKSIINFSLLFGATWVVNSLVFTAILLMVLFAVYYVDRHKIIYIKAWYAALFIALFLNYVVPLKVFLTQSAAVKYLLAIPFFFSAIFFANVIFSTSFKKTKSTSGDYASNILGAVLGGLIEYVSLVTGYRALIVVVGVFYFLAFYKRGS